MKQTRAEKIRTYILENVERHPSEIANLAMHKFSVSRTTVHRHIDTLIKKNLLTKTGHTQATQYFLQSSFNKQFTCELHADLHETEAWDKYLKGAFKNLTTDAYDICVYGFTEMFNNAIDHSNGKHVSVKTEKNGENISVKIFDDGIGIFQKIKKHFNLADIREAVFQLTKGKLTTDPQNHSGEGIFFTSRAFDEFTLYANGILYGRDNTQEDWYIEERDQTDGEGTLVKMILSEKSSRTLEQIFKGYQNPESMAFDKTHILVKFSKMKEEKFISRSQAKRVLMGIEKFHHVILDFEGVTGVGQGFIDEVFRVFPAKHPQIHFEHINTNQSVRMMIDRSIATQKIENPRSLAGD